jgi:hypothetical protein
MSKPDHKLTYVPAVCYSCGEYRPEEFEERVRDILTASPELVGDPDVEWVFTCGACASRGLCPCCQRDAGSCQAGAA